jgi:putative GTP pyrophosphokinase
MENLVQKEIKPTFPGGSKSRVSRAGDAVRNGNQTDEDLKIINTWRASHKSVLNAFQAILRTRTRGTGIVVAQRHKRRKTIFGKLRRLPGMQLARMDDVAGCRLIFPDLESLYDFRTKFHKARFKHRRKNDADRYDYIKKPKETGYRGIHDIYECDINSIKGKESKGLLIELQYRTKVQHAWSTSVEMIGLITSSQPKFQEGDKRYEVAMLYASDIICRAYELSGNCITSLSNLELVKKFRDIDKELHLTKILKRLNAIKNINNIVLENKKNIILMYAENEKEKLEMFSYKNSAQALKALFYLEQENPGKDIVLVQADNSKDIEVVFKNYFNDAREFIDLIEKGRQKLSNK